MPALRFAPCKHRPFIGAQLDSQHICCIEWIMNGKQLKKLLEAHGWRLDRISGSHHIMVRDGCRSVPVPIHGTAELPKGLLSAILKQAGILGVEKC